MVIPLVPKKENKGKLTEHNSAVEANTSSKLGKIFHGEKEPLVPKMACYHHHTWSCHLEITHPILHLC